MHEFKIATISAQDIVDTVREGLLVLDADLNVVSANRGFCRLFNVEPDETVGCRIYDLGDGQWNITALRSLLEDVLPRERSVEAFEIDHEFPGVGRRIVRLNARKVWREGNHVEHILVAFHDATEARMAQIEAERAALVMRSIVDTVRDPLVILDADLRIISASRNFLGLFGVAEADVLGQRIDELNEGQWDAQALRNALDAVVPTDTAFDGFLVEDEFPGLGRRVFKLNARKLAAPGNHVTQLLLGFEDVTDSTALDRHKEMLSAELAHRVKNSLQVISAFVAFEIRRAAEPCREGYEAMRSRINAVAGLYDVIARSSAFGPIDIPTYLHAIAEGVRDSLVGADADLEIVVEAEPAGVQADHAIPLGLLVNELVTNAVKYAFPDGRGRIVVGFQVREGDGLTLSVTDDGVGFDATANRAGASSGFGGRFVDAFIKQMGGKVSRAGSSAGSTVTANLPRSILADEGSPEV